MGNGQPIVSAPHCPLPTRVERFDAAVAAALEEAHRQELYVIARFQDMHERSLRVSDGTLERVVTGQTAGVGVQVFTTEGWSGFAASDDCSPEALRALVGRAGRLARASGPLEPEVNREVFDLQGQGRRVLHRRSTPLAEVAVAWQAGALREANAALKAAAPDFAVRSSHTVVEDEWRVARGDGTDASFAVGRAFVRHELTARSEDSVKTVGAAVSGADAGVLLDPESAGRLERRARRALDRARAMLRAPNVRPGSCRLAVDYSLAKGLAHEAFGHACETDVASTSFLATNGRLRLGEEVRPANASIVQGPLAGD